MVVELNAKDFIRWLFHAPILKRMKPLQLSEAVGVSRRLLTMAASQPDPTPLRQLATDIMTSTVRFNATPVASGAECEQFFEDFAPYLLGHDLEAIKELLKHEGSEALSVAVNPGAIEYRAQQVVPSAPMLVNGPRTRTKLPSDDISERICTALDALKASKCTRPAACVSELLKESPLLTRTSSTVNHVLSREKRFRGHTGWLGQKWPYFYWKSLDPANTSRTVADPEWPERFAFTKCDC